MTKQELLDLIAALFRQACGGLPKDWERVEEAVNEFEDSVDMALWEVITAWGKEEGEDNA